MNLPGSPSLLYRTNWADPDSSPEDCMIRSKSRSQSDQGPVSDRMLFPIISDTRCPAISKWFRAAMIVNGDCVDTRIVGFIVDPIRKTAKKKIRWNFLLHRLQIESELF